jgi:hypothetical protein
MFRSLILKEVNKTMLKKIMKLGLIIIVCLAIIFGIVQGIKSMNVNDKHNSAIKPPGEYLQIIGTRYVNLKDDSEGDEIVFYLYSLADYKIIETHNLGQVALYPVAAMDAKNQKIYYSGSNNKVFDNLFVYDIKSGKSEQITDDKMLFNDLLFVKGKLLGTIAPQGKTVLQPAIIDPVHRDIRYYNQSDDDTWFHSFSYSPITNKLLCLTCSDKEMRSPKVREETFIRPKKILLMNPDFSEANVIYETDAFEIRQTRQIDKDYILMITNDSMASSGNRQIQMLTISSGKLTPFYVEGLLEPQSIHPGHDAEHLYILGRNLHNQFSLYDYNIKTKKLDDLLAGYSFPEGHKTIVDFTYLYMETQ